MSTQNEKPIIFSTPMVQAILNGSKIQSRRVIKPQPIITGQYADYKNGTTLIKNLFEFCPYGQVGDRLWVRETFAKRPLPSGGEQILYKAQFNELVEMLDLNTFAKEQGYPPLRPSWKPSIHMFRKDSRITLEITEVRVERLNLMSEADFIFEGCPIGKGFVMKAQKRDWFKELWDSLNAKRGYGWDTNCWCWIITFKKEEN